MRAYAAQPAKAFNWDPVFSIAPRTKAPVVREHVDDDGELQRTVEFARWGFKPSHATDERLLHAAGLTTAETNSDGEWDVFFTIITRGATDAAGDVHDRMPALLDEELMSEWLAPGKLEKDEREHLHGALDDVSETIAGSLVTHPVDRAVNNVRTLDRSDSSLIAPMMLG